MKKKFEKTSPKNALRSFEKEHDILMAATLKHPSISDEDLALDLLNEIRKLRGPCHILKIRAIGGDPVLLFSRHPLHSETVVEWRRLDREELKG